MNSSFLIVDDDPDLRELVEVVIGRWGHRTHVADTIDEARRLCAELRPDVLLLDVNMPDMDGPSFLASLRADGLAPAEVYLLSGMAVEELGPLAASLDVRYLAKPFTLESLRSGLADVLDQPGPTTAPPRAGGG